MLESLNLAVSVVIALVLHELAHGFMSYKLGDPTPKAQGRLTLNPLAHLDPIGTICLFLFHVGWAKPVSINYDYYKNKKLGTALVSLAGPCMNFIVALLSALILKLCFAFNIPQLVGFFSILMSLNIGLGVFNLIPLPPLDGSKVLAVILPSDVYDKYMAIEQYSMFILFALLLTGVLDPILTRGIMFITNLLFNLVGFV